jgi:hypothetical protein
MPRSALIAAGHCPGRTAGFERVRIEGFNQAGGGHALAALQFDHGQDEGRVLRLRCVGSGEPLQVLERAARRRGGLLGPANLAQGAGPVQ